MGATDLKVKVGADLAGFKSGMALLPGLAKGAAVGVAAAFAAATAAIFKAAQVGSTFEQTLTETATVAQAFGKDLKALEEKARELGKTTAFTATEAAKGMYDLASAGMNTREIVDAVGYAMKFAGATGSEMTQATDLLAATLKRFGMDASESKRVTDTFAAAITNTQLTMVRLTEGMKDAGPAGASLKWSIEETVAALAQFVNFGLEGSRAGSTLKMAMVQLVKETDGMKEALNQMGLSFADVNPETHNFGEILKTLGERSITTKQSIEIFGARIALIMKSLSERAAEGKINFEELLAKLIKAQEGVGRTTEMYDRMMDTFQGKWKIFTSAIQELFITIFDQFKDTGKEFFTSLTEHVYNLANFVKNNGDQIKKFFVDLATVLKAAASVMVFFIENTALLLVKLHELKEQTVEGVKKTGDAIKESTSYLPTFINKLGDAWVDLANTIDKQGVWKVIKDGFTKTAAEMDAELKKSFDSVASNSEAAINNYVDDEVRLLNMVEEAAENVAKASMKAQSEQTKNIKEESKKQLDAIKDIIDKQKVEVENFHKYSAAYEEKTTRKLEMEIKHREQLILEFWYIARSEHAKSMEDLSNWEKFIDGAESAYKDATEGFKTWTDAGKEMMLGFINDFQTLWGDSFYYIMTGQFDSIDEAFSDFFDGLLQQFTSIIGEMAANDVLKNGLGSTWLGAGIAGAGAYGISSMLTNNQNRQTLSTLGSSAGYAIGAQYGSAGGVWGALAGAALGYILGGSIGGSNEGLYSTAGGTVGLNRSGTTSKNTPIFTANDLGSFGDSYARDIINQTNTAMDSIATNLTNVIAALPPEILSKFNTRTGGLGFNVPISFNRSGPWGKMSASEFADYETKYTIEGLKASVDDYLKWIATALGQGTWEQLEKYAIKFENAAQVSSSLIAESFKNALSSGNYTFDTFKENLYDAIFNTVKEGMINALLQSEAFRAALNPFFVQFQTAIENATKNGVIDPNRLAVFMGGLNTSQLMTNINALEPLLSTLSNTLNVIGNNIYGRASGGPVYAHRPYIVGEREPELFVPDTDGYVYPGTNKRMGGSTQLVFVNRGVMTESEFFTKSMRKYQDYKQGDTLQTVDVSVQGLRLG